MNRQFADYCCELLSTQGPCVAKRMFGGWGISVDGLTFAIIADLGGGVRAVCVCWKVQDGFDGLLHRTRRCHGLTRCHASLGAAVAGMRAARKSPQSPQSTRPTYTGKKTRRQGRAEVSPGLTTGYAIPLMLIF